MSERERESELASERTRVWRRGPAVKSTTPHKKNSISNRTVLKTKEA